MLLTGLSGRYLREISLILLYGVGVFVLGYLVPRTSFWVLFPLYALLFGIYSFWCYERSIFSIGRILFMGLLFRLLLLGMTPNWSDDVYRFIWDGRIVANGADPFDAKPSALVGTEKAEQMDLDRSLYKKMNSPDRYSVYPPVEQFVFGASAWIAGDKTLRNNVSLRIFLLLADLAVALALMRLLVFFGRPKAEALLYFLNPLVILEGVGNLHFEVLMIAFLLWGVYFALKRNDPFLPGLLIGAAISTKLVPLIFLPFFIKTHRWRVIPLYLVIGGSVVLSFWPWLSSNSMAHFFKSLNLYFQTFEFNGSVYELVKWVGYQWVGYNIIDHAGPALSLLTFSGIMSMLFFARLRIKKNLFSLFAFALSLQLFLATTVHPWYILPLLAFVPIASVRYPIFWSLLIVLSYSAYSHSGNVAALFLVIEYAGLFMLLLVEFRQYSEKMRQMFKSSLINLASAEKRDS